MKESLVPIRWREVLQLRRQLVTQISNLLVAFALMTLSINLRGAATVALNNYDAHMAIYLADGRMLAPANGSVYVELLGGPSADQLSPVVSTMGVTISTISANDKPGFFDYGVGVVPGVADGATATFQLEVWQGGLNPPPGAIAETPTWTQATGSWGPPSMDSPPPSGPSLQIPAPLILPIPEPSAVTLGLVAVAACAVRRRARSPRFPSSSTQTRPKVLPCVGEKLWQTAGKGDVTDGP